MSVRMMVGSPGLMHASSACHSYSISCDAKAIVVLHTHALPRLSMHPNGQGNQKRDVYDTSVEVSYMCNACAIDGQFDPHSPITTHC